VRHVLDPSLNELKCYITQGAALLAQAGPLPCDTEMCHTDKRRSVVAGRG